MSDGIEKLQECAYDMNQMQCDDVLVLADQIEREHEEELQAFYERYETDLREAREARDIAIKEAAEYNHQLAGIIEYIGASIRKKPVLSIQDRYERIMSCMDRRLMPPGIEWPRFEDGMKITWDDAPEDVTAVCLALDGSCYSLHYDMPDDERMCIYEASDRVKRPGTEVLGADGMPIKVGETVHLISGSEPYVVESLPKREDGMLRLHGIESKREKLYCYYPDQLTHTPPDTQERIDEDATMPPRRYYAEKIGHDVGLKDDEEVFTAVALSLMSRQRELDARTMGGAE